MWRKGPLPTPKRGSSTTASALWVTIRGSTSSPSACNTVSASRAFIGPDGRATMIDDLRITHRPSGRFVVLSGYLADATAARLAAACRLSPEHARIDVRGLLGGGDNALLALAELERVGAMLIGATPGLRAQLERA